MHDLHAPKINRRFNENDALESLLLQAHKLEVISRLAGGIAHDFNNIVSSIMVSGHVLVAGIGQDNPIRNTVEQIFESTSQAAELVNGLLASIRIDAAEPASHDLNDLVMDMRDSLRRLAGAEIDLNLEPCGEELSAMVDRSAIEQAVMNVVTHAAGAMSGGSRLTVAVAKCTLENFRDRTGGFGKSGDYARISISHDGPGTDEYLVRKEFEPDLAAAQPGDGFGFKLAVARGIVKKHGGNLSVSCRNGTVNTFDIYLPLGDPCAADKNRMRAARSVSGGTETILLAEDDPQLRVVHKTLLEQSGYTVLEAADGNQALDVFLDHEDAVDLLAFDVVMPGISGKKAYEIIRKVCPDMKVIFMSGYTREEVLSKGIDKHDFNFLPKPASATDFLRKIRDVLDR